MTIITKFNVGDSVVFFDNNLLHKRGITKIIVGVFRDVNDWENPDTSRLQPCIQYEMTDDYPGNSKYIRYEEEVSFTKEDLISKMRQY